MSKKEHPTIRRKKAAQLLEEAKQEQEKRYMEIGKLFTDTYLGEKPKTNGNFDEFKQKAANILDRTTKKNPSPKDLETQAAEMVKQAEEEESQRKQAIGEQLLDLLGKMQQAEKKAGMDPQALSQIKTANLKEIQTMADQIWRE